MKYLTILLICCLLFVVINATKSKEEENKVLALKYLEDFIPKNITGRKYCATEDVWRWKKAMHARGLLKSIRRKGNNLPESPLACAKEGICDNVSEREKYVSKVLTIPLYVTVVCSSSSSCPSGVSQSTINEQVAQINLDYSGTGLSFTLAGTKFPVDSSLSTISAYGSSNKWYTELEQVKNKYAVSPTKYLNVFVTGQQQGNFGTLLGIGTFPWDGDSLTPVGGLWMNAAFVGYGDKTASHEIGHNVGLWHTFHGTEEVSCNSGCYEDVHPLGDKAANEVGDFCADTDSQPMNYYCSIPSGSDCHGASWTKYGASLSQLTSNIMAYTPDSCMKGFTTQQSLRAKCWVCQQLTWVTC